MTCMTEMLAPNVWWSNSEFWISYILILSSLSLGDYRTASLRLNHRPNDLLNERRPKWLVTFDYFTDHHDMMSSNHRLCQAHRQPIVCHYFTVISLVLAWFYLSHGVGSQSTLNSLRPWFQPYRATLLWHITWFPVCLFSTANYEILARPVASPPFRMPSTAWHN